MAKINANLIGIKAPVEIKTSNKNVRRAIQFMRDTAQAEADADAAKDPVHEMDAVLRELDAAEDFVVDILKLNKSQQEKLEDLTNQEFSEFAVEVAKTLTGVSDDAKATEDDQKSN